MRIPDFGKLTMRLFGAVSRTEHLLMQQFELKKSSKLRHKTKLDIIRDTGVVVLGIKPRKAKRFNINIPFKSKMKEGTLLLMGTNSELNSFEKHARR